jgi:hypothetical protein
MRYNVPPLMTRLSTRMHFSDTFGSDVLDPLNTSMISIYISNQVSGDYSVHTALHTPQRTSATSAPNPRLSHHKVGYHHAVIPPPLCLKHPTRYHGLTSFSLPFLDGGGPAIFKLGTVAIAALPTAVHEPKRLVPLSPVGEAPGPFDVDARTTRFGECAGLLGSEACNGGFDGVDKWG